MASKALKYDDGKPPVNLVPHELVLAAARGFGFGAKKYAAWNWLEGGIARGRRIASLLRHVMAYASGIDKDSESGLSHLDHAAACLAMLITDHENNIGADDRRGVKSNAARNSKRSRKVTR